MREFKVKHQIMMCRIEFRLQILLSLINAERLEENDLIYEMIKQRWSHCQGYYVHKFLAFGVSD